MQLDAGGPADQRRGFAAHDAANSGEPATRYNSAGHHAAWRYQHRTGNGGYAHAEHVGMRREHDDESGNARHDGAGQRHRRRGNAGRIAAGLLMARKCCASRGKSKLQFIKCYLMVQLVHQAYFLK
jgi:hypothetical protein